MATNLTYLKHAGALGLATLLTAVCGLSGAYAGTKDGGGGGAIVCPNGDGSYSARLVDLEEMLQEGRGLNPALNGKTWIQQVELVASTMKLVSPEGGGGIEHHLNVIMNMLSQKNLQSNDETVFPTPQDLSTGRLPRIKIGCQIYGVAVYSDNDFKLDLSTYLWKMLPETHKAALVMHETIYRMHRELLTRLGSKEPATSALTREIVGYFFSENVSYATGEELESKFFAQPGLTQYAGYEYSKRTLEQLKWSTLTDTYREVYRPRSCKTLYVNVVSEDKNANPKCEITATLHIAQVIASDVLEYDYKTEKLKTAPVELKSPYSRTKTYAITVNREDDMELEVNCKTKKAYPNIYVSCENPMARGVEMNSRISIFTKEWQKGFGQPFVNKFKFDQ